MYTYIQITIIMIIMMIIIIMIVIILISINIFTITIAIIDSGYDKPRFRDPSPSLRNYEIIISEH